jgi:hypothetical protein
MCNIVFGMAIWILGIYGRYNRPSPSSPLEYISKFDQIEFSYLVFNHLKNLRLSNLIFETVGNNRVQIGT